MNDIDAIKSLKARYFRTLDTKDWEAFRGVFTDDFVSDTTASGGSVVEGADAFVAFVRKSLADHATVHHGHMPEIDLLSDDEARGVWALEDLVRFPGLIDMRGYGHYHERYRKVDGQWRISYSRLTRLRMDMKWLLLPLKMPQFMLRRMAQRSAQP